MEKVKNIYNYKVLEKGITDSDLQETLKILGVQQWKLISVTPVPNNNTCVFIFCLHMVFPDRSYDEEDEEIQADPINDPIQEE